MPLLIYTPTPTSRINYILHFIFVKLLGCEIIITDSTADFISQQGPKLSYAPLPVGDELFFKRSGFLLQEGLGEVPMKTVPYQDYSICFPVEASAMPFEVFAAAFFLVSRYEEYAHANPDQHGRFRAEYSFAFKNGFLRLPVIDQWAHTILQLIQTKFPDFKITERTYSFTPTIDIDRAYAWKYSGITSSAARLVKALMMFQTAKVKSLVRVLLNKEKDPFDAYQLIQRIHGSSKPIFFFLMGDRSRYDNSISCKLPAFRKLIQKIAAYTDVGIHPSYLSNAEPRRVAMEKARLEEIIAQPIAKSRQHFLKMELPATYQCLLDAGITDDYSMGFASQVGFRAGTCTPFNWYSLSQEKETSLTIHPFAAMEVTMSKYMGLEPDEALAVLKELCDNVRAVNGTFSTLWHNESLTDTENWKGWLRVYEEGVGYAASDYVFSIPS